MKKALFNSPLKKLEKSNPIQSFEAWSIKSVKIFIKIEQRSESTPCPCRETHSVITTFYQKREVKMIK